MHSLWFWKGWIKEYRILWYCCMAVFLVSFLVYWYYYFNGIDSTIHWDKFQEQKSIETIAHSFRVGNFEISIPIDSYYLFEYFNGSSFVPNQFASAVFLVVLIAAALMLLTVITTLSRFYYLVGMGLFILFVVSMRLNVLGLFGSGEQWFTIGVIAAYTLSSFYFHLFAVNARVYIRLLTFLAITVVIGVMIQLFATVNYPFTHLWVTGYIAGLLLTAVFILLIANEIIASFVYLTSQGTSSSKSLRHFLLISVVYIANLIITFMHEAHLLNWNFLYVNLYLLFSTSAVLIIWGYRKREPIYEWLFEFGPFGAFFIISMASIAFITIGSLLGTANDPALKILLDLILFSHLGFGVIFITYVISNFILMMAENMNVYKVLYRPNRMPYGTFRIAGLIATLGFVFYSNWKDEVYNGMSGFYNDLGDLYQLLEKPGLAEAYYQQGKIYGFANNHSNYIVADMEARKNNFDKAHEYYEYANYRRPTAYSIVNEGNLYLLEGKYFTARSFLADALKKFPDSGPIFNNLGYAYMKIKSLDSAILMLEKARESSVSKLAAETNFTGLVCEEGYDLKADSLADLFTKNPAITGNALAIATVKGQDFKLSQDILHVKELDVYSATLLNNYIVHNLKALDSAFLKQAEQIADDSINFYYREALKVSLAHAYYHQNNVSKALAILGELAYLTQQRQGEYNYIMGLWALDQGSPALASSYFTYAEVADYKNAKLYNTIALAESKNDGALEEVKKIQTSKDPLEQEIGNQLAKILTAGSIQELESDLQRYQYCRYRIRLNDSLQFEKAISQFRNDNYRAKAILERAQLEHRAARTSSASAYLARITGNTPLASAINDKGLQHEIEQFELLLMAYRGHLQTLKSRMDSDVTFGKGEELRKMLYETLLHQHGGGNTALVARNYAVLARTNPFFEEGVIAAAQYYQTKRPQSFEAYNILAEAVQVNSTSIKLNKAYAAEAIRQHLDEYGMEALNRYEELLGKL